MLTKSKLRELWKNSGFHPAKRLGQNFLIDNNIKRKILRALEIGKDDHVIEIGPGFGELTFELASMAKHVYAVEKDARITALWRDVLPAAKNVTLITGDILKIDIGKLMKGRKAVVYGNLPYYITTPVIEKLMDDIRYVKQAYILIQTEPAIRITAKPGSRDIGRITLFVQYYTKPECLFRVNKEAFYPSPQVSSTLLKLEVLKERRVTVRDETLLFRLIKSAYGERRKMVLNSISKIGIEKAILREKLEMSGISPAARAEDLSLEDFARLTDNVSLSCEKL